MSLVCDTRLSATIARLLLGDQLYRLRAARRLTLQMVASATYLSVSKLSRIECGRHRAAPADIQRLIEHYEASGCLRGQVLEWVARAQGRSFYHSFSDVTDAAYRDYLDVEPVGLRAVYAPTVIPAVLRTSRYAHALLAPVATAERERRLWLLALRQQRFAQRGDVSVRVLLGQSALTNGVGGDEVMREQAAQLCGSEGPGTEIRVLPSSWAAEAASAGAFSLAVLGDGALTMTATESGGVSPRLVPGRDGQSAARFDALWRAAAGRSAELVA
ncbi:Scr1 family TA system antitoxin-like transcriptional regulator [Streptomyces sp. NPDC088812]|uniref:Scr1 family TA system antitoxin-like transcriptional regulator n=1 Tax=Streptomyces sp. NPDC088812 TaxID=3365905 RepID=UPI00381A6B15